MIGNIFFVLICTFTFLFGPASSGQTKKQNKDCCKTENQADCKISGTEKPWNAVCPVRGGEVNKDIDAVNYNGKEYGFCCKGCDAEFRKDPAKYSKNLSDDGKKFLGKKS